MKKTLMITLVALLAALTMTAQPGPGRHGGPRGHMDPARAAQHRVERLDKALNLTAEQKSAITAIYTEEAKQMQAEMESRRQNGGEPKDEGRKAMEAKRQATEAEVEAVLTPEQKTKYEQLKQDERGHKGRKRAPKDAGNAGKGCCQDGGKEKAAGCCGSKECDKAKND